MDRTSRERRLAIAAGTSSDHTRSPPVCRWNRQETESWTAASWKGISWIKIRSLVDLDPAHSSDAARAQARVAQGARARITIVSASQGPAARVEPPHGLRGGA